jgi:hypothetical protein
VVRDWLVAELVGRYFYLENFFDQAASARVRAAPRHPEIFENGAKAYNF